MMESENTMKDPYEVLNVSPQATDAEIRARYLELVQQYPPELAGLIAMEIRAAYDSIKSPHQRVKYFLAIKSSDHLMNILCRKVEATVPRPRISLATFEEMVKKTGI
jgi:hypothetical protein